MLFTINSFFTAVLGFLGIGSLSLKEYKKQFDAINYGTKVDVDGFDMNVVIQGDQNDQTIVLLPGMGYYSPYYSYKSFTEPLSKYFKVITVEPFGYGLSDVTNKERTNENIITELHTCLQKLGVNRFYLMGHSLGGLYSLAYENKYSDEVLGFIGLENSPNNIEEQMKDPSLKDKIINGIGKFIAKYHFYRFASEDNLKMYVEATMDPNYKYTEEDMKNLSIIYHYIENNENFINESEHLKDNMIALKGVTFKCPVIMFLSKGEPEWKSAHEAMIANNKNGKIIELEGTHMIYINQTENIINEVKVWIK